MNRITVIYVATFFLLWVVCLTLIMAAYMYDIDQDLTVMHVIGGVVVVMATVPFLPKKYRRWLKL